MTREMSVVLQMRRVLLILVPVVSISHEGLSTSSDDKNVQGLYEHLIIRFSSGFSWGATFGQMLCALKRSLTMSSIATAPFELAGLVCVHTFSVPGKYYRRYLEIKDDVAGLYV